MTLSIGRIVLDEGPMRAFEEQWTDSGRSVSLTGILHSNPTLPVDRLAALHDDLLGLPMSLVPVTFGIKSHRNGYYKVDGSQSAMIHLGDQNLIQLSWEVNLVRQGADNEIDLESRLAGPVNRLNDHALGGERWHAPSQAHSAYLVGSDTPGVVTRTGSEGAVKVYRALSQTANPRWHCPVESYELGRVRLIDTAERVGTGIDIDPLAWSFDNSLVIFGSSTTGSSFSFRVRNGLVVSANKLFSLSLNGVPLGAPLSLSVIHNEYERVTVRCMWDRSPSGRVYADLTLRRGSRYVEIIVKANAAATLSIARGTAEASTAGAGFIRATSNDASGHRYVIASLRSFTSDLVIGGISKASVTRFDAILGAEIAGSAAIAGDQAANLMGQYIGTPSEVVQAVRR